MGTLNIIFASSVAWLQSDSLIQHMVCAKTFTYMIGRRMWPLVSSVIIMDIGFSCLPESFIPSLDVASQILLRNHYCSASQSV